MGSCFAACAAFGGRLLQTGLEYKRQEADLLRMRRLTGGSKEDAGQAGAGMSGQNAGEEADWAAKDGATHWEEQTARLDRRRRSREANPGHHWMDLDPGERKLIIRLCTRRRIRIFT